MIRNNNKFIIHIERLSFNVFLGLCLYLELVCLNELYGIVFRNIKPIRSFWWLGIIVFLGFFYVGYKLNKRDAKIAFYLLGFYFFINQLIIKFSIKISFLIEILSMFIIFLSCYFYRKYKILY